MELALKNKRYTYEDYCTWDDEKRWELIDGEAFEMFPSEIIAMSPAPFWRHQSISMAVASQIYNFLRGKPCQVFAAPFDVRLNADAYDDTVVQPDIVVICDHTKIKGTGCIGAPDLIIEILSPATASHDRIRKFNLYRQYGVREYWIIDPETKSISTHILENGRYYTTGYLEADEAPVHILEGCIINLSEVFIGYGRE